MSDKDKTVYELREMVAKFRAARGWTKDTNVKNKVISLVVEAVELLEHFQWRETEDVVGHSDRKTEVVDELADVLYWVLAIADNLEVDLTRALKVKLRKNGKKYPADKFPKNLSKKNLSVYYRLRDGARMARRKNRP